MYGLYIGQTEVDPQRHYEWTLDGVKYTTFERASDIGKSLEDCIAQNKAAEAAKMEEA